MRLKDADVLIKAILDFPDCENGYSDTYDKEFIISEIEAQPTVDAVPVVHGKWLNNTERTLPFKSFRCSVCGGLFDCDWNYCPNCGAKMDGES